MGGFAATRFWSKVLIGDDCWEWQGGLARGYGAFHDGTHQVVASRFVWELKNSPIPNGLWVLHKCDNRKCVRPSHLFLGTAKDNTQDSIRKGRYYMHKLTHCKYGHPLSGDNIKTTRGRRECRTCIRAYRAKREKTRWKRRSQTESYRAYQRKYQREYKRRIKAEGKVV